MRTLPRALGLGLLAVLLLAAPAAAFVADPPLADPAQEARARVLMRQLRCLVCQNQSIDDSGAELAKDLRILVRERITAGDSDEAVIAYVVRRYGDWVLLAPPFKAQTWALWLAPPFLLLIAVAMALVWYRQRRPAEQPVLDLSDTEREQLRRLVAADIRQQRQDLDPAQDRERGA